MRTKMRMSVMIAIVEVEMDLGVQTPSKPLVVEVMPVEDDGTPASNDNLVPPTVRSPRGRGPRMLTDLFGLDGLKPGKP